MTGMNALGSAAISDYQSRTVTIEVTGICQQAVMKTSNYQVRVPYSQMSQALQTINRQGGKVASVQLMGNPPARAGGGGGSAPAAAIDKAADTDGSDADNDAQDQKGAKRKRR
jgi:phycocyanin-associated, rod